MEMIIIVAVVLLIGIIIFISFYFSKDAVVKRKLKKAVVKKISDFIGGETAKIVGKVEIAGELLTAPLSGRKCAYYYVLVEQKVSSGKSSHWKTLIEEEVSGKFVIRDGYNCAYIASQNIKSCLVKDMKYSSGIFKDASENLERYLNAHGYESEGFLGMNKTIRYSEGILEEGETIAILGMGEWKSSYHYKLPERYDRVLAISSDEKGKVYLSDEPVTVEKTNSDRNNELYP